MCSLASVPGNSRQISSFPCFLFPAFPAIPGSFLCFLRKTAIASRRYTRSLTSPEPPIDCCLASVPGNSRQISSFPCFLFPAFPTIPGSFLCFLRKTAIASRRYTRSLTSPEPPIDCSLAAVPGSSRQFLPILGRSAAFFALFVTSPEPP